MSGRLFDAVEIEIIEKRNEPRYEVRGTGVLCGTEVRLRNLSRSGAQLACPAERFAALAPRLEADTVCVELHLGNGATLTASVVYTNPAGPVHLIGVHFEDASEPGHAVVDAFVRGGQP